jgi:hypothetical protein
MKKRRVFLISQSAGLGKQFFPLERRAGVGLVGLDVIVTKDAAVRREFGVG